MANFFDLFPKVQYSNEDQPKNYDTVTRITTRVNFEKTFKENLAVFYDYEMKEGDTPEIIASKIYKSPERHWMLLMYNDIIDPQYDVALESRTFARYVNAKYSQNASANIIYSNGLEWAMSQNNAHSYYKVITTLSSDLKTTQQKIRIDEHEYVNLIPTVITYTPVIANNAVVIDDSNSGNSTIIYLDSSSFANLDICVSQTITKQMKTYFDYENEENENKRNIMIMKPEFVSPVTEEFKDKIRP